MGLKAQESVWDNYTSSLQIRAIASGANAVWIGTYGGLVRVSGSAEQELFLRSNSGLPSNQVNVVAVHGADVWVGTSSGLTHFNGSEWNTFRTDNSPILPSSVDHLVIGPDGEVWVHGSSLSQIQRYENGAWTTIMVPEYMGTTPAFATDQNGALLIGTASHGILRYLDGGWTAYDMSNSNLPSNSIEVVEMSPSGLMYVSSGEQVGTFDGATFFPLPLPPSADYSSAVQSMAFDTYGQCYVTTRTYQTYPPNPPGFLYSRCLRLIDGVWEDLHHFGYPSIPNYSLGPLAVDANNTVWSGSARLFTYAQGAWNMSVLPSCGFVQNGVSDIHCAQDGTVWANVHDLYTDELYQFDGDSWTDRSAGLPFVTIVDVVTDTTGHSILATNTGIWWSNGSGWTNFNVGNSPLPSNFVTRLFVDRSGALWVLPHEQGLLKYDGTWTTYNTGNTGLSSNDVECIAQDDNGVYWIGTGAGASGGGGISRFDGVNWMTWSPTNSNLPYNIFVRDIAMTSTGTPWLRIYRTNDPHQVATFDGTEFTFYDEMNSPLPHYLNCLIMGPDDRPYVSGSPSEGILVLNPELGTWERIDITNSGIPSNGIADMEFAPNNDLWVATNYGAGRRSGELPEIDPVVPSATTIAVTPSIAGDLTTIVIGLAAPDRFNLDVIDMSGRVIRTLGEFAFPAGTHYIPLSTEFFTSGIYVCRIRGALIHSARFCVRK